MVKRNWYNVGLEAFGEDSSGIQIKRNQTTVGRIWWVTKFLRISWREDLTKFPQRLFRMDEKR